MRPFVPPSIAGADSGLTDQQRAMRRAEETGRGKGFQDGLVAGHADGYAQAEAETRQALEPRIAELESELQRRDAEDGLATTLRKVLAAHDADCAALDAACRSTIHAALHLVFPELLRADRGREVVALLHAALQERDSDMLTVRTTATLAQEMRDAIPPQDASRVQVSIDPAQPAGGATIAWRSGGFTYDPQRLIKDVLAALVPDALATTTASSPLCEKPEGTSIHE